MSDDAKDSGRLDLKGVARDAGPLASALVALAVAVGGSLTGSGVAREVQALREAVIRLEGKVAANEGAESRLRALEIEVAALKAHKESGK